MVLGLIPYQIDCPYCGELIHILIDGSEHEQEYIEDCQVCCQPINLIACIEDDGQILVYARREND